MKKINRKQAPKKIFLDLIKEYETNNAIRIKNYLTAETNEIPEAEEIMYAFLDDIDQYKILKCYDESESDYFLILVLTVTGNEYQPVYIMLKCEKDEWKIDDVTFCDDQFSNLMDVSLFGRDVDITMTITN